MRKQTAPSAPPWSFDLGPNLACCTSRLPYTYPIFHVYQLRPVYVLESNSNVTDFDERALQRLHKYYLRYRWAQQQLELRPPRLLILLIAFATVLLELT